MSRFVCALLLILLFPLAAAARVEVGLDSASALIIEDVYLHDGISYLPVDEVLGALGLEGRWDSVEHRYRFKTPRGTVSFFPGSTTLRFGDQHLPIDHPALFIDGRLRVPESFVVSRLPTLLGKPVYLRNLDPPTPQQEKRDTTLERMFGFLLRKQKAVEDAPLRALAIDPGHGGQDPGVFGLEGSKEKEVVLEVAQRLEKLVKMKLGVPVHLSRDADYALTPKQRFEVATKPEVDALIILHAQASASPAPEGISLFVRPVSAGSTPAPAGVGDDSLRLAYQLRRALLEEGMNVAEPARAPLLPLGQGDLPTVMVELGYLTNPSDHQILVNPGGQERLARGLFTGLRRFAEEGKEQKP